ncbi:MAG: Eco57I restriction-modification methylase domain-containing protein, partial [Acidobacteriota bacterium]
GAVDDMKYASIHCEGAILSADLLDHAEDLPGQNAADFGFEPDVRVKDEIARAWSDAQDYWRIFRRKLDALRPSDAATSETRNQWIVPLLGLLGWRLEYQGRGTVVQGKTYQISHRVTNRAMVPVQIIGWNEPSGLERKPERSASRMSAHAMMQEYLNLDEHLYGIVTNGQLIRLLRDSSRLVKLTYVEFDLDRMFSDGLFADFAVFFRLLHATRLPVSVDRAHECVLEACHLKTIEQGTRIREGLRDAVTHTLMEFGNGFLRHPANERLRADIASGALSANGYFTLLLRLVYRLLFLMVVEERGLLFVKGIPQTSVKRYFEYYSMRRLRRLCMARGLKTERHDDAWFSLLSTFRIFEEKEKAAKMDLAAFGGRLFHSDAIGLLADARISNAALYTALERLTMFEHPDSHRRMPVNFGALETEEFGSVYESLLELHPLVELPAGAAPYFGFKQAAGNDRKTTGSYYTPQSLVETLLDTALEPVIEERMRRSANNGYASAEEALLHLTVLDPACGSGHFLIAAAQRIGRHLALVRSGGEEPSPSVLRHALREVIAHCLYGVDMNPMSIELCKIRLWLEAVEPGSPLNFLDHHIKCGNSLIGATPSAIRAGIPDAAYTPIIGDTKEAATWMKSLNRDRPTNQIGMQFDHAAPWERLGNLPAAIAELDSVDDTDVEIVHTKERRYEELVTGMAYEYVKLLHDAWCAAFVWPKQKKEYGEELTTAHLRKIERTPHNVPHDLKERIKAIAAEYQFFHWHLEVPQIFDAEGKGGFDAVLGNPPWERVKLAEKEWFAERNPDIATAPNAAQRKRLIERLLEEDPTLHAAFQSAQRRAEGESHFLRNSGLYPFCGRGDINLYAVFAEAMRNRLAPPGVMGVVLPSGIATDDTTKYFFQDIVRTHSLLSLYDFENRKKLFPDVDSRMKYCLFTAGSGTIENIERPPAEFVFFAHSIDDLEDPERRFTLTSEDMALLNPNTLTCPIFRTRRDAEITKAIYHRVPIFIREGESEANPWGIRFNTMFHMSNDSELFVTQRELEDGGWEPCGNAYVKHSGDTRSGSIERRMLPLYEAKMIHQFDHRWASYRGDAIADMSAEEKADPSSAAMPRYWVDEEHVNDRIPCSPFVEELKKAVRDDDPGAINVIFSAWMAGHAVNTRDNAMLLRCAKRYETLTGKVIQNETAMHVASANAATADVGHDGVDEVCIGIYREYFTFAADNDHIDPLTSDDMCAIEEAADPFEAARALIGAHVPQWLLGFRDITNNTNERTVDRPHLVYSAQGRCRVCLADGRRDRDLRSALQPGVSGGLFRRS